MSENMDVFQLQTILAERFCKREKEVKECKPNRSERVCHKINYCSLQKVFLMFHVEIHGFICVGIIVYCLMQ